MSQNAAHLDYLNETQLQMPYSYEAEQAVLCALLDDPEKPAAWEKTEGTIKAKDLYIDHHRKLFQVIESLYLNNEPVNVLSVLERHQEKFGLDVETQQYIGELALHGHYASTINHYLSVVKNKSNLRGLLFLCEEFCDRIRVPGAKSEELLEQLEQKAFLLSQGTSTPGFVDNNATATKVLDNVEERLARGESISGIATGLKDLDTLIKGLKPGQLIIIAARPGMGKTSLGLIICLNVLCRALPPPSVTVGAEASLANKPGSVLIFSLEMSAEQLIERLLAQISKVSLQDVRPGEAMDEFWERLTIALGRFCDFSDSLVIDETAALTTQALRSRARRAARKRGMPSLILVDYLQLLRGTSNKVENRNLEVTEISQSLKALAKEMACPVIALSQLNRNPEARASKRPVMSDLRDSGAIEQDADLIAFIYRDDLYNPESKDRGTAEIIVAKHRSGSTGAVRVAFIPELTLFANLEGQGIAS